MNRRGLSILDNILKEIESAPKGKYPAMNCEWDEGDWEYILPISNSSGITNNVIYKKEISMKNIENHEATTDIYKDFFIKCCDKMYVAVTDGFTFRGILLNYNSGNIVMYNPTQETICHIPFSELKVLRPIPCWEKKERG